MLNINTWDWRYKVYFSNKIENEVEEYYCRLNKKLQGVYEGLLEFYKSFYTFGILLDSIKICDKNNIETIIDYAVKNKRDITYTPEILYKKYLSEINKLIIDNNYKEVLKDLLSESLNGKIIYDNYKSILPLIFDNIYEDVKRIILSEGEMIINFDHGSSIDDDPNQVLFQFNEIFKFLKKNNSLISKFGKLCISEFDKEVKVGTGYAEWWDESLTGEKNKLILFSNHDSLYFSDLKYTIIHEVYPGHGHFYSSIKNSKNSRLDHGFLEIIEGWATYAEWNSIESTYIQSIRKNALNLIKNSIQEDFKNYLKITYNNNKKKCLSEENNINSIINLSQYIGFTESYYWGAVMFEYLFDRSKSLDCKDFLSEGIDLLGDYLYG